MFIYKSIEYIKSAKGRNPWYTGSIQRGQRGRGEDLESPTKNPRKTPRKHPYIKACNPKDMPNPPQGATTQQNKPYNLEKEQRKTPNTYANICAISKLILVVITPLYISRIAASSYAFICGSSIEQSRGGATSLSLCVCSSKRSTAASRFSWCLIHPKNQA
jgi:hypothetical protein